LALLCCAATLAAEEDQARKPREQREMDRAVQEFKTQTAAMGARADSPKAQQKRTGAGQPWHGRFFENFRNDFLDAVPHEIVQRGGTKSVLRRNQFGFNVTGPLEIPRLLGARPGTFFSFSYEGVRERISRTTLRTVPIVPERTGDFSTTVDQAGNLLPVFDPGSTRLNPNYNASQPVSPENLQYARDQFPGNRIPLSRLDPTAVHAMDLYPLPNASVGPFFQNNFFINSPETNIANGVIVKVDHAINEKHRLTGDVNYSNGLLGAPRWFDTIANPGPVDTRSSTRRASLEHVYTISPQLINTASFEASSERWNSGSEEQVYPVYDLPDYLNFGRPSPYSLNVSNEYRFSDGTSFRKGKHSLRFTAFYSKFEVNTMWGRYPAGYYRFSAGLTSLPGIVNTGHGFASFLLGLPEYTEKSIITSPSYFRRTSLNFSVREQYEVRRNLVLTISAMAARRTPRIEKFDRQSTIDLSAMNPANGRPGALEAAGLNGAPAGFRPAVVRVDPSLGITWSPGAKSRTVVRASYSRSHSPIPLRFGQWGTQGFNGYQAFISPNVQLNPAIGLSQPVPPLDFPLPDLRPQAANDTVADLIDLSGQDPTYQSAGLSVERELPGAVVVTVGASHAGGHNLLVGSGTANPNAIPLEALKYRDQLNDELFNRSLRPFPQYKGFELYGLYPYGSYERDSGYLRIEKRVSKGLSLTASYEVAKQMDDYSGPYGAQDFFNRRNEWSLTPYARPRYLQFSYVYELPIGPNKPLMNYTDWRKRLVEGWSMSGSGFYASGLPLALRPAFNNTGSVISSLRVNVVPGVDPAVSNPGPDLWFNPNAFDQPADFTIGDGPRTDPVLRGPSAQNYDLSLTKRLPIDADRVVEFSAAAFNFLNRANWNSPDVTIGPASAPNVNAGKIIGSHGGRVIQLGLRLSF
jgi:hypothetical protein